MSAVREVLVEWVCMDDVVAMDKIRYNTNNNYEEGQQPEDYLEVTEGTITSKWIDGFKAYKMIDLDLTSVLTSWLRTAARIGIHTGKFPKTFEDELEMLVNAIEPANRDIFDGTEYFIRTEHVSLKCGQHKAGPYRRMKEVVESLVTCVDGHTPITDSTKHITLYFIPWAQLDSLREYRGFVCNNVLTAISQQHLYNVYDGEGTNNEALVKDANIILDYFESVMREKITFLASYTFDIAVLADDSPYFIEMNCFGANYAAGSSLFGWVQDHAMLTGEMPDKLFVRATCRVPRGVTDDV
jgi:hypothetical protein